MKWTQQDIDQTNMTDRITISELKKLKKTKYRNKKVVWNGMMFDSIKERDKYIELHLIEQQGLIKDLERQVVFKIVVNGVLVCKYIADMTYSDWNGKYHVVDVKSTATRKLPVFKLKQKLMRIVNGIEIEIV